MTRRTPLLFGPYDSDTHRELLLLPVTVVIVLVAACVALLFTSFTVVAVATIMTYSVLAYTVAEIILQDKSRRQSQSQPQSQSQNGDSR